MSFLYYDELGNRVYPGGGSCGGIISKEDLEDMNRPYAIGYTSKIGALKIQRGLEVDLAKQPCTIMCFAVYSDLTIKEV